MPLPRLGSRILSTRLSNPLIRQTSLPSVYRTYVSESYGSSDNKQHDPVASNPSSKATHDREHPGPPPPNTSSEPTSSSSSEGHGSEGMSGRVESSPPTPKVPSNKAKPKIYDQRERPAETEDAQRHNEELESRYERVSNRLSQDGEERVEKGFWSGQGGRKGG